MKTRQFLLTTYKETPTEAELVSHKLMLRAGLIRKLGSGLYAWLPLGLKVLKKVENIVREEMDKAGALEVALPAIQPSELWQETGRWNEYGAELLRLKDRHGRDFCFAPTAEEVITDIMRNVVQSYKQLPMIAYQVTNKFRDEIRPRFGVMRAREFLMKDAYSFNLDKESLQQSYDAMFTAYQAIFTRLGLNFRAVEADTGNIGGDYSHEFQVLANSGEDNIAFSDSSDYAANVELAKAIAPAGERPAASAAMEIVDTPNAKTITSVAELLKCHVKQTVKTLLVKGQECDAVALILRGDHEVNPLKVEKMSEVASPMTFLDPKDIKDLVGCDIGSLGPVGLDVPVLVDHSAAHLADFVCGANEEAKHLINVNWERDCPLGEVRDLRFVLEGDASPDGKGTLTIKRGIEVGHIFQLSDKYSQSMSAKVLNEQGKSCPMQMGCYGIGISRIVAAAIEQHHDERGIKWPLAMAPFHVALVPINLQKSQRLREACDKLYAELQQAGYSVLYDDRKERPGVMFADMDLIGIPYRLVMSDKGLDAGTVEFKCRYNDTMENIALNNVIPHLNSQTT